MMLVRLLRQGGGLILGYACLWEYHLQLGLAELAAVRLSRLSRLVI
jgi:hypothetical protein